MTTNRDSHRALRRALAIDAAGTGVMGALLVLAAGNLQGLLGLPAGLLRWVGIVLLPFAALLVYVARRPRISREVALALIGCNVFWAIDSLLLLASGWVDTTMLGAVFVVAQGLVVAAFAYLQYAGLRRSSALGVS